MHATRTNPFTVLKAICLAGILLPVAAQAQQSGQIELLPTPEQYAEAMVKQADELSDKPEKWSYAAALLRSAAQVAGSDRDKAFNRLLGSAAVYVHVGQLPEARETALEAATHALSYGNIEKAAFALHKAAAVAALQNDREFVRSAASFAETLAKSPVLTPEQSAGIRALFIHEPPKFARTSAHIPL